MDPLVVGGVAVAGGVAAALAAVLTISALMLAGIVTLWPKIMDWVRDTVRPWLMDHFDAEWIGLFDNVINTLDTLASALRREAINAWRSIRPLLRDVLVSFLKTQEGSWARVVEVIVKKALDDPKTYKVTRTEEVDWSEMPDAVRAANLRGEAVPTIPVAKTRDQEVEAAAKALDLEMGT